MRMDFILIALLLVAAFFGSRRVKVSVSVEQAEAEKARRKIRDDKNYFRKEFLDKSVDLASQMIGHLKDVSHSGIARHKWRSSAEECLCTIERELSEQDKSGVVTSGSELNVITAKEHLDHYARGYIRCQQMVHANVEKVRDCIYDLQILSKQCSEWAADKDEVIREDAARLCHRIDNDTSAFFRKTDEFLVDADKDPVGIEEKYVTPKVIEFREDFARLCSKIRRDLAAEAKKTLTLAKR